LKSSTRDSVHLALQEKHTFVDGALDQLRSAMKERKIEGFPEMICAPSR